MRLLIDGDILIYQAASAKSLWKVGMNFFSIKKSADAFHVEHPNLRITRREMNPNPLVVKQQLVDMVLDIQKLFTLAHNQLHPGLSLALTHTIYVKGNKHNYRSDFVKEVAYKANRAAKPFYHEFARQSLINDLGAIEVDDQETDDELGIQQNMLTCICTKDKDLLTIPGLNFNWVTGILKYISEQEADKYFYEQILIGDRADNIKGLPGIGPKKAEKILEGKFEKKDLLLAVIAAFEEQGYTKALVEEIGQLMYIRRRPDEMWTIDGILNEKIH